MHDGPKDSPANVGTSYRGSRSRGQSDTAVRIHRVQRPTSPLRLSASKTRGLHSVSRSSQALGANSLEQTGWSMLAVNLSLVPGKRPNILQLPPVHAPAVGAGVRHTWASHVVSAVTTCSPSTRFSPRVS